MEQGCGATLESAKSELETVNNTTQNNDLKLTTMPRLVNFVLLNQALNRILYKIMLSPAEVTWTSKR